MSEKDPWSQKQVIEYLTPLNQPFAKSEGRPLEPVPVPCRHVLNGQTEGRPGFRITMIRDVLSSIPPCS